MTHELTTYDAARHEDFVYGTWLGSYAKAPVTKSLQRDVYYAYQRGLIAELLRRAVTVVAEDKGLLLGWACAERVGPTKLAGHYVFVKPRDRELGIAASLMAECNRRLGRTESDRIVATHSQPPLSVWMYRKGWAFEPRYLSERNRETAAV